MIKMSQEDPSYAGKQDSLSLQQFFYIEDRRYEGALTATGFG